MKEPSVGHRNGRGLHLIALSAQDLAKIHDALEPGRLRDLIRKRLERIEGRLTAGRP